MVGEYMQVNKNDIPVDLVTARIKRPVHLSSKIVKKKDLLRHTKNRQYAEVVRYVDGLEQAEHIAVGSRAYREALANGFEVVSKWEVPQCQH